MDQLNYIDIGSGNPVVLLHGLAASLHDWDAITPALIRSDFRVLAPDLPGHGDSPKPVDPSAYTIPALFKQLELWLNGMDLDQPIHLVGHSLGGCLSIMLARSHPDWIKSLTLIDPLYRRAQLAAPLRFFVRQPGVAARLLHHLPFKLLFWAVERTPVGLNGFSLNARRQSVLDLQRASPLLANVSLEIPDLTEDLQQVAASIMLIWGESDLTLAPDSFHQLAALLPSAQIHQISRCGHQPHISHALQVCGWLLDFLFSAPR